jgi:hypothetical protein
LIDRESEINPFDSSGIRPEVTHGFIDIGQISFSYPTRPDALVLDEFTLQVPAGKVTALVVRLRENLLEVKVLTRGIGNQWLWQKHHNWSAGEVV